MKYSKLVEVLTELDSTSKRLEKTHILSKLLKEAPSDELQMLLLLLQGRVFPIWDERKIGVAARTVIKAISIASGASAGDIEKRLNKTGDLGIVARDVVGTKSQHTLFSQPLSVRKVFSNIQKLSTLSGTGTVDTKTKLIAELLSSASPLEAQYIVRTVLEELRIGVGEGSIRDAIVISAVSDELGITYDPESNSFFVPDEHKESFTQATAQIQEAYDITSDFGMVAKAIRENGLQRLSEICFEVGKPVRVMLFKKAKDIDDAFKTVGKPAAFEYKYDGFRIQAHRQEKDIWLFTRRLENVTRQFPDIVKVIKSHVKADSFILDCEAIGYNRKTNQYLPFQKISQRIRRKYDIEDMAKQYPVELNVFDILYHDGRSTIKLPFNERRRLLSSIIEPKERAIVPSRIMITDKDEKALEFYNEALDRGNEGIMAKNLEAEYKPGSRVGFGVKIKPVMESLDLAIVAAEWGQGKRAKWLTSFVLACRDDNGNLMEIGKVSTGLKELREEGTSYEEMTEMLSPAITAEEGQIVRLEPRIVIEVHYEEIQKSTNYASGYALRFPRFIRLRLDRGIHDISTLDEIEELYFGQRGRDK